MDEYELARREREADETLHAVDPDFARELGYAPPQHLGQAERQDPYGSGHALGSLVGGGVGAALGGAILRPIFGRRR